MSVVFRLLIVAVSVGLVFCADAATTDFSRYSVILARKPFGDFTKQAAQEQQQQQLPGPPQETFIKFIRMIAVTDDELGLRVGLFDLKEKKSFFLSVGEVSEDGIQLVSADFEEGAAVLRKDDEEHRIYMDGRSPEVSMTDTQQPSSPGIEMPPDAGDIVVDQSGKAGKSRALSYIERRRIRIEAMRKAEEQKIEEAAKRKLESVDREKLLREYNLDLIRARGEKGQPLPIQLTPEEDARLVKEGVLPPQE